MNRLITRPDTLRPSGIRRTPRTIPARAGPNWNSAATITTVVSRPALDIMGWDPCPKTHSLYGRVPDGERVRGEENALRPGEEASLGKRRAQLQRPAADAIRARRQACTSWDYGLTTVLSVSQAMPQPQ